MFLQKYNIKIIHKSDKSHTISDALSKLSNQNKMNFNIEVFDLNVFNLHVYVYMRFHITISEDFKLQIIAIYKINAVWALILFMLENLKKRNENNDKISHNVEFKFRKDFIYHIKKSIRLCILMMLKKEIFKLAHNKNAHKKQNWVLTWIWCSFYIKHLNKCFTFYIKHCFQCQLNQTHYHRSYDELNFILMLTKSFNIITMNWILNLSMFLKNNDILLIITNKFLKKILLIFDQITWKTLNWGWKLLLHFQKCNWNVSHVIISD